jgi:hypothetical protein
VLGLTDKLDDSAAVTEAAKAGKIPHALVVPVNVLPSRRPKTFYDNVSAPRDDDLDQRQQTSGCPQR